MTYQDLEAVRKEAKLGLIRFLRLIGLPKTTYYRRRKQAKTSRNCVNGTRGWGTVPSRRCWSKLNREQVPVAC